ncbi:MAG TPA: hypothetical protein VEP73_09810 [Actinomycetota bacterium]|nr:hypothetical protein [Actinomycetota bacterium]
MPAFFLLLAIVGGIAVGDLVLENTSRGEVTVLNQAITGYTEGQLLAAAAALGFVVALLLAASVSAARARRVRRTRLHTATRNSRGRMPEPEGGREHLSPRDEHARPADLERDRWVDEPQDRRAATAPQQVKRSPEPLYEESRRAARLHHDPDLWSPRHTDDRRTP